MSKSITIWVIAATFIAYAGYNAWMISHMNSYWFLLWVVSCLFAAVGLVLSKAWSQYFVHLVALFTAGGWVYVVGTVALNRWPYHDTKSTVISLLPGIVLVLTCIFISVYVFMYFRRQREKT